MSAQFDKAGKLIHHKWPLLHQGTTFQVEDENTSTRKPGHRIYNADSKPITVSIVQSLPKDGPVKPSQAQQLEVSSSFDCVMHTFTSGKDELQTAVMSWRSTGLCNTDISVLQSVQFYALYKQYVPLLCLEPSSLVSYLTDLHCVSQQPYTCDSATLYAEQRSEMLPPQDLESWTSLDVPSGELDSFVRNSVL